MIPQSRHPILFYTGSVGVRKKVMTASVLRAPFRPPFARSVHQSRKFAGRLAWMCVHRRVLARCHSRETVEPYGWLLEQTQRREQRLLPSSALAPSAPAHAPSAHRPETHCRMVTNAAAMPELVRINCGGSTRALGRTLNDPARPIFARRLSGKHWQSARNGAVLSLSSTFTRSRDPLPRRHRPDEARPEPRLGKPVAWRAR
jgi:hypothetical protein